MNKTPLSIADGGVKKRPPTRLVNKRALSANPSRSLQPTDPERKGNRRCASLNSAGFSKGGAGMRTANAKYTPSLEASALQNNFNTPEFSVPNNDSSAETKSEVPVPLGSIKMQRLMSAKKRDFLKMRKTLVQQQKTVIELYASYRELEQRSGCEPENLGELRVVSVTSWPAHDLLLVIRDDLKFPISCDLSGIFGPQILQQLYVQLSPVTEQVLKLGAELMARRMDVINYLRNKTRSGNNPEQKTKNSELDQETEELEKLVATTAENLKAKINFSLELAKVPWLDRDGFIKKCDRLQKENLTLQHKIEELEKKSLEGNVSKHVDAELTQQDSQIKEELAKEKAASASLKEVVATAEGMLRVARGKISNLERQLKETKAELETAHRKHKDLEQLYRHRESSLDARSKKLLQVSKTGEMTIEVLSRQRDALEIRVKELREKIEMLEKQAESRERQLLSMVEGLQMQLAEQEKKNEEAAAHKLQLENKLKELHETIHNLRERSGNLIDMERMHCLDYLPQKEGEPSDRETELWKELQMAHLALARANEELRQSRTDKENFLETLTKIAQDRQGNLHDKMATELLEKEKKITQLNQIVEELRENEKMMEQGMTEYEDQLASLRLEVRRLRNYDCYSKADSTSQLQTELMEMSMRVEALTRERAALVSAAASRGLMLERHERSAELFARMTRARRELAALLEGRSEPPSVPDAHISEVSRSLSSMCMNAMETWSALRAERARVLQLESTMLAQSLQMEREGRVRTQLERRRAMLQRELIRVQSATVYETTHNVCC